MLISRSLSNCGVTPLYRFAKDYYAILGVSKAASYEEIRKAYAKKASTLHPDVSTVTKLQDNVEQKQFQDVAEAFAVLSNIQSRNTYDILQKEQPELLYNEQQTKYKQSLERDDHGKYKSAGDKASEYAQQKQEYLRKERKLFNVDDLGHYQGGLPQKDSLDRRGSALMGPSMYHRPLYHNMIQTPLESEQQVTAETVEYFKVWSNEERIGKEWSYLYQVASVDYEYFKFHEYRMYYRWMRNAFIFVVALPFLLSTIVKTNNRYIIQEIQETMEDGLPIEGKIVNGYKVVVGKTGTLRLEDIKPKESHH